MKKGLILAGRYTLQKDLGQGLFGDAYLAHDEGTGLDVTVKTLNERISRDERILEDVRRNFQLLQNLDHQNIVKVHALEFDALTQGHFLVREYVEGVSLAEYRMRYGGGKVPLTEALEICRQIAMALDHAHRSLLHRDLRPDNILVSEAGEVKLLNFCLVPESLAKEIRAENRHRDLESSNRTHGYMAPEQFFGFPPPGPAADRYALVAIFYELVSGRPPFDYPEPQALMHAICNMAPPMVRDLGRRRNHLISQGMSKDPGNRFLSAMAFIEAMEASPLLVLTRYAKPWVAAATVLGLLGGLIWFFNAGGRVKEWGGNPGGVATAPVLGEDIKKEMDRGTTVMLRVESRPAGAQVTMDGKRMGMTPLKVGQVIKGRYALKLEKVGYTDVVVDMELAEDTVVDLSLDAVLPGESVASSEKPSEALEEKRGDVAVDDRRFEDPQSPIGSPAMVAPLPTLAGGETSGPPSVAASAAVGQGDDQNVVALPGPVAVIPEPSLVAAASDPVPVVAASDPTPVAAVSDPTPVVAVPEPARGEVGRSESIDVTAMPEPKPLVKGVPAVSVQEEETVLAVKAEPLPVPPPLRVLRSPDAVSAPSGVVYDEKAIARLLKDATRHFRADRLTSPLGNNALESYKAVLAMDPGRQEALSGVQRVASRLLILAQEDIDEGRLSQPEGRNALVKVTKVGELDPANPKTGQLLKEIAEKYVILAQSAAEKGDRGILEARLAQARAVAPGDPFVVEAYQKLLHRDIHTEKLPGPVVVDDGKSVPIQPEAVSELESERDGTGISLPVAKVPVPSPLPEPAKVPVVLSKVENPTVAGAVWKDPVTGMEFVEISKGCFNMGTEMGDPDEAPAHRVCLDGYRISKLEVTQGVWKKIMGSDNNPSKFNQDDRFPVDSVSWNMAMEFIHRLNEKAPVAFRLPTEAEWENACRAGGVDSYQFGPSIQTSQANFNGTQPLPGEEKGIFRRTTTTVGSFAPNRFGLFDMHGNVYEWVEDWYVKDYYGKSPERNPIAQDDRSFLHVLRGGAWHSNSGNLRCGYRYRGRPDFNNFGNGFRLASSHTGG
ncbi:MAG: SUMF1/EgtB/PvdO family nonheme iron enzyme [Magnetococcus sp. THC-1_WYH]